MMKKDENAENAETAVNDDEVMITSSISDLEKMLEGVEQNTNIKVERTMLKFEKLFFPALFVFGLIALGGFFIIYSITTDMTKLAKAMDPKMGENMSAMVVSIDKLSDNVAQMNQKMSALKPMLANMNEMNNNMLGMQESMLWMRRDIATLRSAFARPMGIFNAMPIP